MKRFLKLFVLFFLSIFICSCKDLEVEEGELIEISGVELTKNFYGENCKNFIFAIVNEYKENTEQFKTDLKRLAKETRRKIYYVSYQHLDLSATTIIFNTYEANFTTNGYFAVDNNTLTVNKSYKDYETMKDDLKEIKNEEVHLDLTTDKEIKEILKESQEYYDKGQISHAFDTLNQIWDEPEAKEFYQDHPYLSIIKPWEHFIINSSGRRKITYKSLLFYHGCNYMFEIETTDYYDKFEKPANINDYTKIYYYIKDNNIYTSNKEDGTYKIRFNIKKIEENSILLYDTKNKKEYRYTRRG